MATVQNHKRILYLVILAVFVLIIFPTKTYSQDKLVIATYHCPPFVIHQPDGSYEGLSILLWQRIAETLNLEYQFEQHSLKELLTAVETGKANVGVSCISITPERERVIDFSHSFYETHLAIAVKKQGYWQSIVSIFTNTRLLMVLGFVFACACFVGGIYYLLEHKVNDKLYSMKSTRSQLVEGFILGLLFITKGPFNYYEFKTLTGRVITVLLAVATTLFIASITAVLASTFTLGLINSDIKSPNDLANVSTGAKQDSTSSLFLTNHSIVHTTYPTVEDYLTALDHKEVDAVVGDDAILKYQIKIAKERGQFDSLIVLPYQFEKQNYGFALEENSPYEEEINRALLEFRQSNEWRQALLKYFAH
ncbi:transporter substrate-binding domain-containing protein [Photobacterium damselae]